MIRSKGPMAGKGREWKPGANSGLMPDAMPLRRAILARDQHRDGIDISRQNRKMLRSFRTPITQERRCRCRDRAHYARRRLARTLSIVSRQPAGLEPRSAVAEAPGRSARSRWRYRRRQRPRPCRDRASHCTRKRPALTGFKPSSDFAIQSTSRITSRSMIRSA